MSTIESTQGLVGAELRGPGEEKLAEVRRVVEDPNTGEPTFAEISIGRFGRGLRFVPLTGARTHEGHIHVPYDRQKVKGAPEVGEKGEGLTRAQEAVLHDYYGTQAA